MLADLGGAGRPPKNRVDSSGALDRVRFDRPKRGAPSVRADLPPPFLSVAFRHTQPQAMRWVISTLLASSSRVRHCPPKLFGENGQPQLAEEEYRALAGVWRADLELDDGDMAIPLHLAAPPSSQWGPDGSIRTSPDGAAPAGRVYPMDDTLPFNILQGSHGRSTAWWSPWSRWAAARLRRPARQDVPERRTDRSDVP